MIGNPVRFNLLGFSDFAIVRSNLPRSGSISNKEVMMFVFVVVSPFNSGSLALTELLFINKFSLEFRGISAKNWKTLFDRILSSSIPCVIYIPTFHSPL